MLKGFMPKVLFYYSAVVSIFIVVSMAASSSTLAPTIFVTLFLPVVGYFIVELFKRLRSKTKGPGQNAETGPTPRKGEVIFSILAFLILLGIGINNVFINNDKSQNIGQNAIPTSTPVIVKKETPAPKNMFLIKITDGSESVNVRAKATVYSDKIGVAKDGEEYENLGKENGWCKIKYNDTQGFVSAKYVTEKQ